MKVSPVELASCQKQQSKNRRNSPGLFIVLEGVNGAGKSSLQRSLNEWLTSQGQSTLCSHEPGGTPLGTTLRKLLLENRSNERTPLAEALLFSADRAEHVTQVLQPALQEGKTVILDRYYYSTVAFQGYGHQTPIEPLLTLSQIATQGLLPDVVLLLDIEPKLGLERNSDKNASDSFEQEELSFHSRLREGFLALADTLPEPFGIIDAVASQDEVFEQAKRFIVSLFHD